MKKMNYTKKFATHMENINKMRSRGVIISDVLKAEEYLSDIGYYRLGYYVFPFETTYPILGKRRDRNVVEGTTIEDIVAFYYYNMDLRNIMYKYLSRIEVAIRSVIVYELSNKYKENAFWYVDKTIVDSNFIKNFKEKFYDTNIRNKEQIKRFHKKYNEPFAPVWKAMEFTTFGNIETLYINLLSYTDKCLISKRFGEPAYGKFENYLSVIREVRNACAHGSVIVDLSLSNTIKAGSKACPTIPMGTQNTFGGALRIIDYILRKISVNRTNDMWDELYRATRKLYSKVPSLRPVIERRTGIVLTSTM